MSTKPDKYAWIERNLDELMTSFDEVDLDVEENTILRWLAGWDQPTISAFKSIFAKLVEAGAAMARARASHAPMDTVEEPAERGTLPLASPSP